MKKNKSSKEVSRLRAQIEILKSQMRIGPQLFGSRNDLVSRPSASSVKPSPTKELYFSVTAVDLKADLRKTLALTIVCLSFIFLLKVLILPHQDQIIQRVVGLYQSVITNVNRTKIK